jgi:hypothetical protein
MRVSRPVDLGFVAANTKEIRDSAGDTAYLVQSRLATPDVHNVMSETLSQLSGIPGATKYWMSDSNGLKIAGPYMGNFGGMFGGGPAR